MRYYLEYISLLMVAAIFRYLPLKAGLKLGAFLGKLAWRIDREHRRIALKNIELAVGLAVNKSQSQKLVKMVYLNLGRSMAEFFYMPRVKRSYLEGYVHIEGKEILDSALAQGKGVILVLGHFGNWELNNAIYGLLGYPITAVAFKQNNPLTDKVINQYRQCQGVRVIYDQTPYSELAAILRKGQILALVADQDAGSHGVFVDFLGRPASTAKGPAVLALRTGAPLIVSLLIRQKNNCHHLIFKGPLKIVRSGEFKNDLWLNTRSWSRVIEDSIRDYPDQWFWLHRRWKTSQPLKLII